MAADCCLFGDVELNLQCKGTYRYLITCTNTHRTHSFNPSFLSLLSLPFVLSVLFASSRPSSSFVDPAPPSSLPPSAAIPGLPHSALSRSLLPHPLSVVINGSVLAHTKPHGPQPTAHSPLPSALSPASRIIAHCSTVAHLPLSLATNTKQTSLRHWILALSISEYWIKQHYISLRITIDAEIFIIFIQSTELFGPSSRLDASRLACRCRCRHYYRYRYRCRWLPSPSRPCSARIPPLGLPWLSSHYIPSAFPVSARQSFSHYLPPPSALEAPIISLPVIYQDCSHQYRRVPSSSVSGIELPFRYKSLKPQRPASSSPRAPMASPYTMPPPIPRDKPVPAASSPMASSYTMPAPIPRDKPVPAIVSGNGAPSPDLDRRLHGATTDPNRLSAYGTPYHSNNASPGLDDTNTPAESISTLHSHQQPSEFSEFGDPDSFFGVDFSDAEGYTPNFLDEDSIMPASRTNSFENPAASAIRRGQAESQDRPAESIYPLTPGQTASIHTASPASDQRAFTRSQLDVLPPSISPMDLQKPFTSHLANVPAVSPHHPVLELTPEPSRSSRSSEDGPTARPPPSAMPEQLQSPRVTVSLWGKDDAPPVQSLERTLTFDDDDDNSDKDEPGTSAGGLTAVGDLMYSDEQAAYMPPPPPPKDDGIIRRRTLSISRWVSGPGGLDPSRRSSVEVASVNEMVTRREVEEKNQDVDKWLSENLVQSPPQEHLQASVEPYNEPGPSADSADDGIPLGHTTQNKFEKDQLYILPQGGTMDEKDLDMLHSNHRWGNAPMTHPILKPDGRRFQPESSNAAIARFNRMCQDNESIVSRAATWGTRRRSLPSLIDLDIEGITSGGLFKKLSIGRGERGHGRRPSILQDLRGLVRRPSASQMKRARSHNGDDHQAGEEGAAPPALEKRETFPHLTLPTRASTWGAKKTQTPSINTALVSMGSSVASIGTTHARSGSISAAANVSPRNSFTGRPVKNKLQRGRSKSDMNRNTGAGETHSNLAEIWRLSGGPPVATLATSVNLELEPEDDEDDDEELYDDSGRKQDSGRLIEGITPTFAGFREHIIRLNPALETQNSYLADRIAHQQTIRYKALLNLRVKHLQLGANCPCGPLCMSAGGSARATGRRKGDAGPQDDASSGRYEAGEENGAPMEGAITKESFPQDIPMPPVRNLPAEFECQLCFQSRKFDKPSDWTKHVHEDVQPFTCTWERCRDPKMFKRKADWVRHENEGHRHLEWWTCDVEDCRHTCYRRDNFQQHLVREHKFQESKVRSKAALRRSGVVDPIWQKVEVCHADTTRKPQDEACRFCGKTFPSWKKLTVHLAKHMEQISLPVLRLVAAKELAADTVISPVHDPPPRTMFPSAAPLPAQQQPTNSPGGQGGFPAFPQPGYQPGQMLDTSGLMASGQPLSSSPGAFGLPMANAGSVQEPMLSSHFGGPNSGLGSSPLAAQGYHQHPSYQQVGPLAALYNAAQQQQQQQQQYMPVPQAHLEAFPTLDQTGLGLQQPMGYDMFVGQETTSRPTHQQPNKVQLGSIRPSDGKEDFFSIGFSFMNTKDMSGARRSDELEYCNDFHEYPQSKWHLSPWILSGQANTKCMTQVKNDSNPALHTDAKDFVEFAYNVHMYSFLSQKVHSSQDVAPTKPAPRGKQVETLAERNPWSDHGIPVRPGGIVAGTFNMRHYDSTSQSIRIQWLPWTLFPFECEGEHCVGDVVMELDRMYIRETQPSKPLAGAIHRASGAVFVLVHTTSLFERYPGHPPINSLARDSQTIFHFSSPLELLDRLVPSPSHLSSCAFPSLSPPIGIVVSQMQPRSSFFWHASNIVTTIIIIIRPRLIHSFQK
ncbi:hypothetical protein ACRALDRAFT_210562 [Sodiomyces alcalophilus JCM 7366]|uniref:uncharacterized protein n=1 Tax=Sodiomyces alcalophilus JCM 7366 TaxID=591952 RepID=UPI0039B4D514